MLIPGFGSKAILDFSGPGDDLVRLDPLVSVAASLNRDEPIDVFVVDTPTPLYWRMVALPDFDGTTWRPDAFPTTTPVEPNSSLLPVALPSPDAPGLEEPIEVSFQGRQRPRPAVAPHAVHAPVDRRPGSRACAGTPREGRSS